MLHALQWRQNERDGVSNHRLNWWFRRRSNKTSKLRVTGLCAGNSPVTGEFPAQKASNAENFSIWWRHHDYYDNCCFLLQLWCPGAGVLLQAVCGWSWLAFCSVCARSPCKQTRTLRRPSSSLSAQQTPAGIMANVTSPNRTHAVYARLSTEETSVSMWTWTRLLI